jgi:hypothetical protein
VGCVVIQGDFLQKSPFALTVHAFGVRGILDANDVWIVSLSRVIFSQKSPFALTVHTFGVRGIPAPTVESMMLLRHPG